jgi:hypothetical protein
MAKKRPSNVNKMPPETVRQQAIEALHESTRLLQAAFDLLQAGKHEEAKQVREASRLKAQESAALTDEAMRLK